MNFRIPQVQDATRITEVINGAYRAPKEDCVWTTESALIEGTRISADIVRNAIEAPNSRKVMYVVELEKLPAVGIVGCVGIEQTDEEGLVEIGTLAVAVGMQGKGLGKALLQFAEEKARTDFHARYAMMHVLHMREDILAWYARNGYLRTDDEPIEFGELTKNVPACGKPKMPLNFLIIRKNLHQN